MKERFGVPVGLSDHSMGSLADVVAVSLGAQVIEKHVCLSHEIENPDAAFSMEMKDFAQMVKDVRMAELSLGKTTYELTEKMRGSRSASRSLYVAEDMKAGEVITERNVRSVRPGFGLHPKYLKDILGKNVNRDLEKGTRFALEYVNG